MKDVDDILGDTLPKYCKKCEDVTPHIKYREGKFKINECDFCGNKVKIKYINPKF